MLATYPDRGPSVILFKSNSSAAWMGVGVRVRHLRRKPCALINTSETHFKGYKTGQNAGLYTAP